MPCYLDKCNKSCAIDTTSACPPVDPIDNTLGSPCTDPSQVPCLNELNAEDQIVDPFLQIEACGSIPMWNFTCDNNYSKEVRRYLFDGRFEDGNSGDQMAQFDEYQCFTGGLT